MIQSVPTKVQILVIGGGPAGSYAASALAREGFDVVLLEATKFPRYHIGESLLPSARHFLRFIGAEETVQSYGFTPKPGGAIKLNQHKREGYTDFSALDPNNVSWHVVRADFDDILLKHAAKCGATVIEETKVTGLQFVGERPVSASWASRGGIEGQITFDYLVDASGRNGVMSTNYLHNRRFNKNLSNIACWGYWEGAGTYMPGTPRENAVWIEALPGQSMSGWVWFIPLHDGTRSVGIVMDADTSLRKKKDLGDDSGVSILQTHYLQEIHKVPGLMKLLGEATLKDSGLPGAIKSASDYSYSVQSYAGDHYRIAGDAAAFIDPFFSSGIHLALTGALSAAVTISASIRGFATEAEAQRWHTSKVGTAFTRFLFVVLGAYKQIRNQSAPVMSDVDEDNFDRAFDLLRPVIQGTADVGKALTEDELQKMTDFLFDFLFAPTDLEMHKAVRERITPELMRLDGTILTEAEINKFIDPSDEDARHVLRQISIHKQLHATLNQMQNFGTEDHFGFKAVLERGSLVVA